MGTRAWLVITVGARPGILFCTKKWNSQKVFEPRTNSDHNCSVRINSCVHPLGFVKRALGGNVRIEGTKKGLKVVI